MPKKSIMTRKVLIPIANYAILAFLEIGLFTLLALFLATPINIGGLGFDAGRIGLVMGVIGITNTFFQLMFFALIQTRFGSKRVFTFGVSCFVFIFAAFPVMNVLARQSGDSVTLLVWCILIGQLLLSLPVSMTWSLLSHLSNYGYAIACLTS